MSLYFSVAPLYGLWTAWWHD